MALKAKEYSESVAKMIMSSIELFPDAAWHKQWELKFGFPTNVSTKKSFSGSNIFALMWACQENNWPTMDFATAKQWHALGANVPSDAYKHGTQIMKLNFTDDTKDTTGKIVKHGHPYVSFFWELNAAQVDLANCRWQPQEEVVFEPIEYVENLIRIHNPHFVWGQNAAVNIRSTSIHMPYRQDFENDKAFAQVFFHEFMHWGDMKIKTYKEFEKWGDEIYAHGELVAEIGSFILCQMAGIHSTLQPDTVGYIRTWLSRMDADDRYGKVLKAAAQARKIITYLTESFATPIMETEEEEELENVKI